jgi:hypothetical protein
MRSGCRSAPLADELYRTEEASMDLFEEAGGCLLWAIIALVLLMLLACVAIVLFAFVME